MSNILGIDHGTRRIGLALGSEETGVAVPLPMQPATGQAREDARRLARVIEEYDVDRIVIGLPLNMDGTSGSQVDVTRAFAAVLAEHLDLPIEFTDERLSSRAADEALRDTGLSSGKRKRRRDSIAAAVILQAYLDGRRASTGTDDADTDPDNMPGCPPD